MNFQEYKLETPGGSVEILAENDGDAKWQANVFILKNKFKEKNLKLFRYPANYTNKATAGLIEVAPFVYFVY